MNSTGPKLLHSFHSYEVKKPIPKDVLSFGLFSNLGLREVALASSVCQDWNRAATLLFDKTVLRLYRSMPSLPTVTRNHHVLDLASLPRPASTLALTSENRGLDLATAPRSPVAEHPMKMTSREFLQKHSVPTLQAGIDKIVRIIGKLGANERLAFEIKTPFNPGGFFRGEVGVGVMLVPNGMKREATFFLEQSHPGVQSLEDYKKDIETCNKMFNKVGLLGEIPASATVKYRNGSDMCPVSLTSCLPPNKGKLSIERILQDPRWKGLKEAIDEVKLIDQNQWSDLSLILDTEHEAFLEGISTEMTLILRRNNSQTHPFQNLFDAAVFDRMGELEPPVAPWQPAEAVIPMPIPEPGLRERLLINYILDSLEETFLVNHWAALAPLCFGLTAMCDSFFHEIPNKAPLLIGMITGAFFIHKNKGKIAIETLGKTAYSIALSYCILYLVSHYSNQESSSLN